MAELLIKAQDSVHDDPIVNARLYKRGDIVVVMEDGHQWGKEEGLPKFIVLKLPGVLPEQVYKYTESEFSTILDSFSGKPLLSKKRAFKLDVDNVPSSIKNALKNGVASTTWSNIRSKVIEKKTGLTESGKVL